MALLCCPTCNANFDSNQTTALPFCSERCRLLDLGRWLNEKQRLMTVRDAEEDAEDAEE